MSFAANHPANRDQAKVMNRFDIIKRMVARLKHDEAVIGGIGYTNFDLWAAGRRPQNFYVSRGFDLTLRIARGAVEIDNDLVMRIVRRHRDGCAG